MPAPITKPSQPPVTPARPTLRQEARARYLAETAGETKAQKALRQRLEYADTDMNGWIGTAAEFRNLLALGFMPGATPSVPAVHPSVTAKKHDLDIQNTVHVTRSQPVTGNSWVHAAIKAQAHAIDRKNQHRTAIANTGVGLYYGDHSPFHELNPQERASWLQRSLRADATPSPKLIESSCIVWALENVRACYAAAGKLARWNDIRRHVNAADLTGASLARELRKDGWETVYFNRDTAAGATEFATVQSTKTYAGITVDHYILDYQPRLAPWHVSDPLAAKPLERIPFYYGFKHEVHTFVGYEGVVSEFHYRHDPSNPDAIEEHRFANFDMTSGLILVPPGTWPPLTP